MINQFSRYENAFKQWVSGGYPDAKPETLDYIRHLSDPKDDTKPREGTLWAHQWEAFLRVIYAYEIERNALVQPNGALLNVVTGGGKTAIIAALMVWLRSAHDTQKFVLLCPNLIVRDRLEDDFDGGKVFQERDLIPKSAVFGKDDFALTTLGSDRASGWATLLGATVILGNIHQFYASSATGQSNLSALMNGPQFALFNDEAHNSPAPEWEAALEKMRPKIKLRVDTTATPDRADEKTPDSKMIYEYLIQDALADRLVKTPVVYQPSIETVELTYTDARSGETRAVEQIDWDDVDRRGLNATQWVTDDRPMQQQMAIALHRLREQERRAKGRYQPVLFVVAVCKLDAIKAARTLEHYFKVNTLLVTEDSSDKERRRATELSKQRPIGNPYKAIVSVLMLREGWDVPEVGVILLLRKFGSPVYGQQVIGRGLRRVRRHGVQETEQQICAVVDHPKLDHQWLWNIFSSKMRKNVGVDDEFDETEDLPDPLPRQELLHPENLIDIPDPTEDDGEFSIDTTAPDLEPLCNWREVLEGFDYLPETVSITDQSVTGVERMELTGEKWVTLEAAPEFADGATVKMSREEIENGVKSELLQMSENLLSEAGHTTQFSNRIYSVLLQHVRMKFLDGASLGLAEDAQLNAAWYMLPEVKERISSERGLVEGMVKYGD